MQCERKLKLCHAAALVLSGWVLLQPPPVKDASPDVNVTAPFSQWSPWPSPHTTYASQQDCENLRRKDCQRWLAQDLPLSGLPAQAILRNAISLCTSVCLSSDDPRLRPAPHKDDLPGKK